MQNILRPAPFVLISTNHGSMILNRNDYRITGENQGYGVGYQLMTNSAFDPDEVQVALVLLQKRRTHFGDGVVAIDGGANIGVHTLEWARFMYGWGHVHSFEAQEKIFYALAGNIILNNCLNVSAQYAALGAACGEITIPEPNYHVPSSYGSFELRSRPNTEFIGQAIDYTNAQKKVRMLSIDSLKLPRVDFIKIDVEGMEEEVLQGASETVGAHKPILLFEIIKSDPAKLQAFIESHGYRFFQIGINLLCVHRDDPTLNNIQVTNGNLSIS